MFSLIPWKRKDQPSTAVARRPEHPIARLRDEFDNLFDRFWSSWPAPFEPAFGWEPLRGFDVEETDREMVVRVEVPGFEPSELDVQVSGQMLTIRAEKKEENGHTHTHRSFRRSVTLPPGIDPEHIEARCRHGVLEVHVPRYEPAQGKRIPVHA